MKLTYRILRALIIALLSLVALVPAGTYIALSLPAVHRIIARNLEQQLSSLLDARVVIGSLDITPFNRVNLRRVAVITAPSDTAMFIGHLSAGISIGELLADRTVVNYVGLFDADIRLWRDSLGAPLNIEPIIRALTPKDTTKAPTNFQLRVNTVVIRGSRASYNVNSIPHTPGRFNPHHIAISNLRADISLPRIARDDYSCDIRRLACAETSGLRLEALEAHALVTDTAITVKHLRVDLPASLLAFKDFTLPLPHGLKHIPEALHTQEVELATTEQSHLWPGDFAPLFPPLADLQTMLNLDLQARGNLCQFQGHASLHAPDVLDIALHANGKNLDTPDLWVLEMPQLKAQFSGPEMARIIGVVTSKGALTGPTNGALNIDANDDRSLAQWLNPLGQTTLAANGRCSATAVEAKASVSSDVGTLSLQGKALSRGSSTTFELSAETDADAPLQLGKLLPASSLADADFALDITGTASPSTIDCQAHLDIPTIGWRGHSYTGLLADASYSGPYNPSAPALAHHPRPFRATAAASAADPDLTFVLDVSLSTEGPDLWLDLNGSLDSFHPSALGFWDKYHGADISARTDMRMNLADINRLEGYARISDLCLAIPSQPDEQPAQKVTLKNLLLQASNTDDGDGSQTILALTSDYLNGNITGQFDYAHLPATTVDILAHSFNVLSDAPQHQLLHKCAEQGHTNDFTFTLQLKETESLVSLLHLPVSAIYPVTLSGQICQPQEEMSLVLSAPYLRQGNKLIENTLLTFHSDGDTPAATLRLGSTIPTKEGPMRMDLNATGASNILNTSLSWKIDRPQLYQGDVSLQTTFSRSDASAHILTDILLRQSQITFNDSTWTIHPATISIAPDCYTLSGLDCSRQNQYVKIDGTVSRDPQSLLKLDLKNFSLDYLFESLGIDKVQLGGNASGTFYASDLLSPNPVIQTPGLDVEHISYNKTVFGHALVTSHFDPSTGAIALDAAITDPQGRKSFIDGAIYPLRESLDLTFRCNHVPVGFMQHYMEAFASDISGFASGRCRLFGTFKYVDLEGDVLADSLRLKVNFTNTYYTAAGDSIHFRPGLIDLNGITIRDSYGHPAALNGWVRHAFFKEPRFQFSVTGAKNFMAYDETESHGNGRWFGRVFGTGGAWVKGEPGTVDINVDMTTDPGSTFTFVLSDQEVADEYSFLTFRDKSSLSAALTDTLRLRDTSMDMVNELRARAARHDQEGTSIYNIILQMGITPDAQIVLVMDPASGDRIRCFGSGNIRMEYGSANNDLRMYGNYTLDRGSYNFTLQDIIIKDFTIKEGSKISFQGDPYSAQLDIHAAYALQANLSDLDDSFLQDKDLNRTNVPVHAVMNVSGDMRQPEIAFDLEFPTLTSDIYRKVRSIISTDDMMNRQIIYLLALNRFYTPDYMASTTRGNELMSVASSTISSQLSSILGQIADNWTIAPALRSDRGDFSDVEVDVALSSRLLNNRLLFNGNFGYRDKSLNTNQFVGDFDLEYLLNRSGNIRLKAYNRYNDQNYYLRTAQTTQGVGVVLKKDFDSLTDWITNLFRRKKRPEVATSEK